MEPLAFWMSLNSWVRLVGMVFLVMPIFLYVANLLIYTFGIFVEKIINIESEISDVKLFLSKDSPKDLSQIKKENKKDRQDF